MDPARRPKGLDSPLVPRIMRLMSRLHVWLYRLTGGFLGGKFRIGAAFPWGVPVLLLTVRGRKTGVARTTPLLFLRDGERIAVVGSQGGLPRHPQWFQNLQADPDVQVQIKRSVTPMRARVASDAERAVLWPRLVALYADFASYQSWTTRVIPVVLLEPPLAQGASAASAASMTGSR